MRCRLIFTLRSINREFGMRTVEPLGNSVCRKFLAQSRAIDDTAVVMVYKGDTIEPPFLVLSEDDINTL